jgi:(2R)-3-sulfolactate dehydrogenase (NADP+)
VNIDLETLKALAVDVLAVSRTSRRNAGPVAEALVAAEADGLPSHGISRLPFYADQSLSGKVDGFAVPRVRQIASAALHVDACDGFAFPAINEGLKAAATMAARSGVVAVAIGRSHHFGVAGFHVERLASRGLVSFLLGNSPAAMAPWGGSKGVFGTNPLAFACPRRHGPPLVVDLSLSHAARGRIMMSAQQGEPIPAGWALDAAGQPTCDARAALAGTLLPIGDAKGAALALFVEIVAAGLTQSHFGYEASSFFEAAGAPPRVGQFFFVLDPGVFAGGAFLDRVEDLFQAILAQPGTRLPGDRRHAHRARAEADGVTLPDPLYEELLRRRSGPQDPSEASDPIEDAAAMVACATP